MGTSPNSHFKSTAVHITVWSKWLFVIDDAKLSVQGLPAMIETFAPWRIHLTAGMVMVEGRHQPPMQRLNDGSNQRKPLFGVRTTDTVFYP